MATTTTDEAEKRARLFAFVKETTQKAQAAGVVDRAKAGREVGQATQTTYRRLSANRLDLSSEGGGRLMDGVSARSWHTTRAALLHQAAAGYIEARRACDAAQKAGDLGAAVRAARVARRAVEAFEAVEGAVRPPIAAPKASKRKSLPAAEGWQQKAYEAATPAQRGAVAVLWAVGCRPAELEQGVDVRRGPKGVVVVDVPGAKVRENAGQPRRSVAIDPKSGPGQALLALLGDAPAMTVKRGADRIRKDFADIRRRLGVGLGLSAYSFRHQFAAEVKAKYPPTPAGAEQVAAAMGHRTTKSQKHYGSKAQAKGGGGILAVKAALPVRDNRPAPAPAQSVERAKKSGPSRLRAMIKGPDPSGPAGP